MFAKQDSKPRSGPAVLQLVEKPFSETSRNCKMYQNVQKDQSFKAHKKPGLKFKRALNKKRGSTCCGLSLASFGSPSKDITFRSREVESNEDPTRFLTFPTKGLEDIWTYQSQKTNSSLEFPAESLAKGGGCGRVIVRRHDE